MKCIVVNGDDLGASPGVNRGMAKVARRSPLASASLMVNMPASAERARLANGLPMREHSPERYLSSQAIDLLAGGLPAGDAAGRAT